MTRNLKKIKVTIIYPLDLYGKKLGGTATLIKGFIKYAPTEFDIEFVGISEDKNNCPPGVWRELELSGRKFRNYPLIYEPDSNRRTIIPLTYRFVKKLIMNPINVQGRILVFHRIEPSLPFWFKENSKVLFIHRPLNQLYNHHVESRWSRIVWLYSYLEKVLISKMNRIYSESEEGICYYKRCYQNLKDQFYFLPTWADDDIFYPHIEAKKQEEKSYFLKRHNFPPDTKLILFAGRLEKQKNPLLLLKSLKFVGKHDKTIRLVIAGTGTYQNKLKDYIEESGLQDYVIFLGALSQYKLAEIMRLCDIFLLTSGFEGMSLSVLEALASGLPVVTTHAGEVKRVVSGGSGIVVKNNSPDSLGMAILKVLSHPDRFNSKNCLEAVGPYNPESILKPVYKYHYDLYQKNG